MEGAEADEPAALPQPWSGPPADGVDRAAALLRAAQRPVIMAGTNLYWGRGEGALLDLTQELGIPVFLNGLARGCVPADHEHSVAAELRPATRYDQVVEALGGHGELVQAPDDLRPALERAMGAGRPAGQRPHRSLRRLST